MRRQTSEWTVRMLADLRGRIDVEAEYQRGSVWSEPQQQRLIDSRFRGYDLPKIFLRKLEDGSTKLYEVVDGVQRLTAIWRFLGDEYSLPRSYKYADLGTVGGKSWSELPPEAQDRLQFSKVTVTELETADEEDIRELFQRLQQGEPLNAAERRHAMTGPVRDFVADVLAAHPLWQNTGIRKKRFGWEEMSAVLLALAVADGPTGLKAADLLRLYELENFDPSGEAARSCLAWMDELNEIASVETGVLRTRWGVVDLFLALDSIANDAVERPPDEVMSFFVVFEEERRSATADLSDLRSTAVELAGGGDDDEQELRLALPSIASDMFTYITSFAREGATEGNVRARALVMTARLRRYLTPESKE